MFILIRVKGLCLWWSFRIFRICLFYKIKRNTIFVCIFYYGSLCGLDTYGSNFVTYYG